MSAVEMMHHLKIQIPRNPAMRNILMSYYSSENDSFVLKRQTKHDCVTSHVENSVVFYKNCGKGIKVIFCLPYKIPSHLQKQHYLFLKKQNLA
jgi:hypothetical protein